MKKVLGLLLTSVMGLALIGPTHAAPSSHALSNKASMFYAVMAHPDDETAGWNLLRSRSNDYIVFITMSMGEGTSFCWTPEKALDEGKGGPYGYQGPGSPIGEPNLGERDPLGNPWVGVHTEACKRARIASWHWFLDDAHDADAQGAVARDPLGTNMEVVEDPWDDDDYVGPFCAPGHQGNGDGRPIEKRIGCAHVWANDQGARIAFDLGNGDPAFEYNGGNNGEDFPPSTFGRPEIAAALAMVREKRAEWGLPVLPETGMVAALFYDPTKSQGCSLPVKEYRDSVTYDHPDHAIVYESLRLDDHGAGPQYGPILCNTDPVTAGAALEVHPTDARLLVEMNNVDFTTNERLGAGPVNYGWLFPRDNYGWGKSPDVFWRVFD